MTSSPALKWFVLLLLPLTLGWKLAVRPGGSTEATEKDAQTKVAEFLVRQHFSVGLSEQATEGQPSIRAASGVCRMLITQSPEMGWDRDLIRRNATAADRVFVVYRGRVYAEQPTWLTVPDSLWTRFRRELGQNVQVAPVLAVIATESCEAERLPWGELN